MARRSPPVALALWLCVGAALISAAAAQKKLHKDQVAFGNSAVAAIKDLVAKAKEYKLRDGNKLKTLLTKDKVGCGARRVCCAL
jgi:hypothetical protein